jgi:hypothetical protein
MLSRSIVKSFLFISLLLLQSIINCADWTQLQYDAQRTGRTTDTVQPPFRLRWMWFGSAGIIRNHLSNPSWTGPDLAPQDIIANEATLPESVPFTFASFIQPIIAGGKVYVGDMDGKVYCINADDGSTVWTANNPGGTVASCVYANNLVVFGSISRYVRCYNATTGTLVWEKFVGGAVTGAPVTNGTIVCVGSHEGHVYCFNLTDGNLLWKSPYLGAQVAGGLAMDDTSIYVGAENMYFYALNISDGSIRKSVHVQGQSFYLEWPVVFSSYVFIQAAGIPCIGSEYVMEGPMQSATDIENEQDNILRWYQGDTNNNTWKDASPDWKHLTVLNKNNFTEPFIVPVGPYEGCGTPPEPVVIDNQNRVLSWWKTKYPKLTATGAFGTSYSLDISAINLSTGRRIVIDNGKLSGTSGETDNLFGLTVGGNIIYMRQNFRGTKCIDYSNSTSRSIQVQYSWNDGASWLADIIYNGDTRTGAHNPSTSMNSQAGRVGPAISGNIIFFTETFAVVAIEHHQQ